MSVRRNSGYTWYNTFTSGFEFNTVPNGTWHVDNPDGDQIKWQRNAFNSSEGNYSVKLDNFNNTASNTDAIITDKIIVDRATAMNFTFKYAVASRPGAGTDQIVVSVSDDCGASWNSVRTILGPQLYAAINKATAWNPTSASNWRTGTANLNDYAGGDPIMVKIDFISGGGNNAFLDEFSLNVTLNEEELDAEQIALYPNPSNGTFTVDGLPTGTAYQILAVDGRLLQEGQLGTSGTIQTNAAAGYYIFQAGTLRKPFLIQ